MQVVDREVLDASARQRKAQSRWLVEVLSWLEYLTERLDRNG
jgi:hypothetical protein